jgi:hypothetical protein
MCVHFGNVMQLSLNVFLTAVVLVFDVLVCFTLIRMTPKILFSFFAKNSCFVQFKKRKIYKLVKI